MPPGKRPQKPPTTLHEAKNRGMLSSQIAAVPKKPAGRNLKQAINKARDASQKALPGNTTKRKPR